MVRCGSVPAGAQRSSQDDCEVPTVGSSWSERSIGEDQLFLPIDVAASLSGHTPQRLRALARRGALPYRGSQADPLFPLSAIRQLRTDVDGYRLDSPAVANVGDLGEIPTPQSADGQAEPDPTAISGSLFQLDTIVHGHVLDVIRSMPSAYVQAVVCSPPYWGQRVYEGETPVRWAKGQEVAFGREAAPEEYVAHTLEILRALMRVLRADGTIWWNIADTYMTRTIMRTSSRDRIEHYAGARDQWAGNPHRRTSAGHPYLKDKDLTLVPFQIAIGAQHLGYWVRSVIVWSKQRASDDYHDLLPGGEGGRDIAVSSSRMHVPEIVADRPVTGHEYILLLTKRNRYAYDPRGAPLTQDTTALNVGSVWTFPPVGTKGNHGARFPDELPRRCILLGSKEGDLIFDPFAGQGTTLRVAKKLGRRYFGCDISATYVAAAQEDLRRASARERPAQPPLLLSEEGLAARRSEFTPR